MQWLSSIVGLLAYLPLAGYGDTNVQARFDKSLTAARSLGSVEIVFLDTLSLPQGLGTNKIPFSRTFQYSYLAAGPKYRAECRLIAGTQTNLAKLSRSAFDGTSYSSYDADNGYMTRRKEDSRGDRAQSVLNPLVAPFRFWTRHSLECPQCMLRFNDIVSGQWTNGMMQPGGKSLDGLLEISVPGLSVGKETTTWRFLIDEAGDSFNPKTISEFSSGPNPQVIYRLSNYTNLGAYQFPTRIEWSHLSYSPTSPPTLLATGLVTLLSARVPDQIADSRFKLDEEEKSAVVVWDWDQKAVVKSAQNVSTSKPGAQPRAKIYDESLDGSKQIADALALARKERKHVLLQFGANWCGWCHKLHKLFQSDQRLAQKLDGNYVVVMIDMNDGHNKDVNSKYGNPARFGLPAIVVLDADGKQLTTQNTGELEEGDHHSPEKVMAFLNEWSPRK